VLDIQSNRINDVDIVDILAQLPNLKVLYLQGNEVVKHVKQYRKTLVYRCRKLKYLDDRPVFDDERRRVEAWGKALEASNGDMKAAQEAERDEMDAIRREKKERDEKNFLYFEQMMIDGRRKRREEEERKRKAENPERSEDQAKEEINPFSGENIIPVQDCAFLQHEREKRWEDVVNAPDEHDFGGSNAVEDSNQNGEHDVSMGSAGAIPVDERRMEVLHQCATVGAASTSGKDAFVNTSFHVSKAGSGGIGEVSDSVAATALTELKETDETSKAGLVDTPPAPPMMLAPPPAPVVAAPQPPAKIPAIPLDGENEVQAPESTQETTPLAPVDVTDSSTFLLPPPPPPPTTMPTEEVEEATQVLPPPPPPTHTDVNELD
jgi:hypothetical protein